LRKKGKQGRTYGPTYYNYRKEKGKEGGRRGTYDGKGKKKEVG